MNVNWIYLFDDFLGSIGRKILLPLLFFLQEFWTNFENQDRVHKFVQKSSLLNKDNRETIFKKRKIKLSVTEKINLFFRFRNW